jgi:hypothetical protein
MFLRGLLVLWSLLILSATSFAGTQRALLIGISNYQANLTPLAGSRNDVLLIRELLVQKYGFEQANIRTMLDEEATRAEILAAIRTLSETAASDDIVLIHYSGHGSQAPDTNGDEPDGQDETILPYDSRTPGIADITDDELNALISGFRSKKVIVTLDSCHSGTGTRGGPSQVTQRWVAPDTRRELYEKVTTRQVLTLPISENHVFFAAAQDFESELDGPFGPDNMRLGLFTAAMVGALTNSPVTITPREAIAGVSARVEALKANAAGMPIPEPNMEAPLVKQGQPMFVFANEPAPQVVSEPESTPVLFTSAAQPEFSSTQTIFATMSGMPQRELAQSIARSIDSGIVVAAAIDDADAVIDVVGQDVFDIYGPAGVVQVASGLSRSQAIAAGTASSSSSDFRFLKKAVLNAPTLADLVSLNNSRSGLEIELRAAGVPDVRSRSVSTRTVKVSAVTSDHKLKYYQQGAPRTRANSLQLEVISNQDCYLTVASLNSEGDVHLLLPNVGQELSGFLGKGRLIANTRVLIPDSLAEDNAAGFYYDYSPPGGTDRVIAVCFSGSSEAERFRAQIAKLELGGTLDAGLFAIGTRGATNITPSLAPPAQAQTDPSQAPPVQSSVDPYGYDQTGSDQASSGGTGWAAAKLSLTVGTE